jgi:hypothetical protein
LQVRSLPGAPLIRKRRIPSRPCIETMACTALLASSGTLICCALPALLVAVGAVAALSSLVSAVPQLV